MFSPSISSPGAASIAHVQPRVDSATRGVEIDAISNKAAVKGSAFILRDQGIPFDQSPAGKVLSAPPAEAVKPMANMTDAGMTDRPIGAAIKAHFPDVLKMLGDSDTAPSENAGSAWRTWADATGHKFASPATLELIAIGLELEGGGNEAPIHFCLDLLLSAMAPKH
jgi:hypothetical protein